MPGSVASVAVDGHKAVQIAPHAVMRSLCCVARIRALCEQACAASAPPAVAAAAQDVLAPSVPLRSLQRRCELLDCGSSAPRGMCRDSWAVPIRVPRRPLLRKWDLFWPKCCLPSQNVPALLFDTKSLPHKAVRPGCDPANGVCWQLEVPTRCVSPEIPKPKVESRQVTNPV